MAWDEMAIKVLAKFCSASAMIGGRRPRPQRGYSMSVWSKFLSGFRAIAAFVTVAALAGAVSPVAAQQLGEAFLAQPDDITKAVQVLRGRADASGNLQTTQQQRIVKKPPPPGYAGEAPQVVYYIEPVEPEVYYVPVYDPVVIFGVGY